MTKKGAWTNTHLGLHGPRYDWPMAELEKNNESREGYRDCPFFTVR